MSYMGWVKAKFQSEETRPPLQNSMNKKDTDIETNWERLTAILEGDSIPHDPEVATRDPIEAKASWDWLAIRKGKVVRRGKRGPQKSPTKKLVSLRLSPEVVDHFKSTGPGWQTRIDRTLLKSIKKRA